MIPLTISKIDSYIYTLINNINNKSYNLMLESFDKQLKLSIGDKICFSKQALNDIEKYNYNLISFGDFGSPYGRSNITENELVIVITKNNVYAFQRYYG